MDVEHIPTAPDDIIRPHMKATCGRTPRDDAAADVRGALDRDDLLRASTARCCCRGSSTTRKSSSRTRARSSSRSAAPATKRSWSPPAWRCKPGYDWFYPYYRDRALCLQLGMTPLEMLLARRRREGRPELRRPPDAVALGPHARCNIVSQSSPTGTQCLQAVGCAEAGVHLRAASPTSPDRERALPRATKSSTSRSATARRAKASSGKSLNTACTQAAAGRSSWSRTTATRSRCRSKCRRPAATSRGSCASFPGLHVESVDGTDFLASYPRDARGRRATCARARARRSCTRTSSARTRIRCPTTRSCTRRRRSARPRRGAIRSRASPTFLKANGLATDADLAAIAADVEREVNDAADRRRSARRSRPRTPPSSGSTRPTSIRRRRRSTPPAQPEGKPDTMVAAINRTLKDEMARNPRIVVFGEDVADASRKDALAIVSGKGGVFKVTHGLQRLFGDDRVFNSPLAEANIIGRAVGMAVRGIKPVVEIQFFDYIWPAMMQMRDEMSMMRYRSGNTFVVPDGDPRRRSAATCAAARRTTASRARASSRTAPASASRSRRTRATPPACCARRSAATTRCCSSSTSTCTARPTTRASTPAPTT